MYEKSLEVRHFLVSHYPQEARLAPHEPPESLGGLRVKKRLQASRLSVQYNGRGLGATTEIRGPNSSQASLYQEMTEMLWRQPCY